MKQRLKILGLVLCSLVGTESASAADFVGAESCRACHRAAYDQWQASPHAHAFQSLTADQQKDARCLLCHARDQAQGGDPGVTCETCHGAGQYYWPDYVMRDHELAHAAGLAKLNDSKLCSECHDGTGPTLAPFDPAQGMKAIDHWTAPHTDNSPKAVCPGAARLAAAEAPWDTFLGRALRSKAAAPKRGKRTARRGVHIAAASPASASRG